MIKILLLIAALCLAIFLGPFLINSQGLVHIVTNDYVIETSITFSIIALLIALALFVILFKIIFAFIKLPKGTYKYFANRHQIKNKNLQEAATIAYEEGDYLRAFNLISKTGKLETLPVSAIFILAKSAFYLNKITLTKQALDYVIKHYKEAKTAAIVIKTQLNLEIGNVNSAIEYLDDLKKEHYQTKLVKKLSYSCLQEKGDINDLYHESNRLLADHTINDKEHRQIFMSYISQKLNNISDPADIKSLYKSLDSKDKLDLSVMCPIIEKLVKLGDLSSAKKLTLKILKTNPGKEILESISRWEMSIPDILNYLEDKANDNLIASQVNVPLLKALGNLELKEGKLEKAREHFEKALELSKTKDLYLLLANTLSLQQHFALANKYYAKACNMQ